MSHPLSREFPFLPDLARLEWRIAAAFHAFEKPPIDPARFADLPSADWDRAHLVFQPSVACLSSSWPIRDIWNARTQPVSEIDIEVVNRAQRALIFRRDMQVVCELIEEGPCRMLATLLEGATLGEACRDLAERSEALDPPVAEWCSAWVQRGLVVNIF